MSDIKVARRTQEELNVYLPPEHLQAVARLMEDTKSAEYINFADGTSVEEFKNNTYMALAAEATVRANADTALDTRVTDLEEQGGTPGADGKSAYQIALDEGFVGTEEEWLESLKGADGDPGPKGDPGTNGTDGESFSVDAVGLLAGRSAYDSEAAGFSYLATDTSMIYFRQGASGWSAGVPFGKGDKGDTGDAGPEGPQGPPGAASGISSVSGASGIKAINNSGAVTLYARGVDTVDVATSTTLTNSAHANKFLFMSSANPFTVTISSDANGGWQNGDQIEWIQYGGAAITFASGSGAIIVKRAGMTNVTAGQFAVGGLKRVAGNTWALFGDVMTT